MKFIIMYVNARTSLFKFSISSFDFSSIVLLEIFQSKIFLVFLFFTLYTFPNVPSPIWSSNSYAEIST